MSCPVSAQLQHVNTALQTVLRLAIATSHEVMADSEPNAGIDRSSVPRCPLPAAEVFINQTSWETDTSSSISTKEERYMGEDWHEDATTHRPAYSFSSSLSSQVSIILSTQIERFPSIG